MAHLKRGRPAATQHGVRWCNEVTLHSLSRALLAPSGRVRLANVRPLQALRSETLLPVWSLDWCGLYGGSYPSLLSGPVACRQRCSRRKRNLHKRPCVPHRSFRYARSGLARLELGHGRASFLPRQLSGPWHTGSARHHLTTCSTGPSGRCYVQTNPSRPSAG
jgi:hypothetical protein